MPYDVNAQHEANAQALEKQQMDELVRGYQQQLAAYGANVDVPSNWYDQAGKDWLRDHSSLKPKDAMMAFGLGSAGNAVLGYKGRKSWRQKQKNESNRRGQVAALQDAMARAIESKQNEFAAARGERQRKVLGGQVDAAFNDPARIANYNKLYTDTLNNYTGQIGDAYRKALTSSVQHSADQGLIGGSVDTQRRADLGASRDQGLAEAANSAGQLRASVQGQDQSLRQQLMDLINSGDPTAAAAAQARLGQLNTQLGQTGWQGQNQQLGWNVGDFTSRLQSQAIGSAGYGAGQINNAYTAGRYPQSGGSGG